MDQVDEKDVQAFNELQRRIIELTEKQKYAQQQDIAANQALRKAVLTASELEKLSDHTPLYEAVGRGYFLTPRPQLLFNLQNHAKSASNDLKRLKETQEGLKKSFAGVEREISELLTNSQGLAQAFAASH